MNYIFLLASVLLVAPSCNSSKKVSEGEKEKASYEMVSLRQGACFGTCAVFTMTIQSGEDATYDGKQYAPYKGIHIATLPADSLSKITKQVKSVLAQADKLPREIDSGIVDLAMSTITIVSKGDTLEFRGTTEYATPVAELRNTLLAVAKTTAWQQAEGAEPLPSNQLLITLAAPDQIQVVTERYYRQQMKMVRMVSEEPATFLVTFDPYTMSAEEIVRELKRNKLVQKVIVVENQ